MPPCKRIVSSVPQPRAAGKLIPAEILFFLQDRQEFARIVAYISLYEKFVVFFEKLAKTVEAAALLSVYMCRSMTKKQEVTMTKKPQSHRDVTDTETFEIEDNVHTIPLRFTEEEFRIMVEQLHCGRGDMAYTVMLKILNGVKNGLRSWKRHPFIREYDLEQDLEQFVLWRLLMELKDKLYDKNGNLIDPNHFQAWVLRTGYFRAVDFTEKQERQANVIAFEEKQIISGDGTAKKMRVRTFNPMRVYDETASDEDRTAHPGVYAWGFISEESIFDGVDFRAELDKKMKQCLCRVLRSGKSTHRTILWIAYQVLVNLHNVSRSDTEHWIEEKLSDKTIEEIFEYAYRCADRVDWMRLDAEDLAIVRRKLDAIDTKRGGCRVGDIPLREFYYRNKSGHDTLSDWITKFSASLEKLDDAKGEQES